jgi:hypothetical protein
VEKIINLYLKFTYQDQEQQEEIVYSNLAGNTFNYLVDTDHTLKVLPYRHTESDQNMPAKSDAC